MFVGFEFVFHGYGFFPESIKFPIAIILFVMLFSAEMLTEKGKNISTLFLKQPKWVRWTGYYVLIILIFIYNAESEAFAYMEF